MSREARDWAWAQAEQHTIDDPLDLLILLDIADVADEHGCNSYPSQARLAKHCLSNDRTIRRHLVSLTERGLLEVQAVSTRAKPTVYRIRELYQQWVDKMTTQNAGQNGKGGHSVVNGWSMGVG